MGNLPVSRETFYMQAKDGGFGPYSLHDRFDICKVLNLGLLLSSEIGDMMERYIAAVAYERRAPTINSFK
jgi:hypothetical protein